MLKNQNRKNNKKINKLSSFFLYLKLLKKWGVKHKKNFIIANFFMVTVAVTTSLYPLVIDFTFNVIEKKDTSKIFIIPILILGLTFIKGFTYFFQTIYVGKISFGIIKDIQISLYEKILNFDVSEILKLPKLLISFEMFDISEIS